MLRREAHYLHEVLFGLPLPEALEEHYVKAHAHVFSDISSRRWVNLQCIVDQRLDAEAIELVLRRRSPRNLLTQKLQMLSYLAEARREYYAWFILEESRPVWAFLRMGLATFRTAWKLLKGLYLVRRYHVV
jgi:hypothetical protein